MSLLRVAHLSDLHFADLSWSPLQFFSKRWLGNVNLLFSRRPHFFEDRLKSIPELLTTLDVGLVVISGDLSTTSRKKELTRAALFVKSLEKRGIEVIAIPGNHDHYTKSAFRKKLFYDYFSPQFDPPFNLKDHGVAVKALKNRWWVVALDTAIATSWISSQGLFSEKIEENLKTALKQIPEGGRVIIVNHFPFFQHQSPRKTLIRAKALQETLRAFPKICFYLHGHTHIHTIADLRPDGLPFVLDSGSTPHKKGSWNLIDIRKEGAAIDVFQWNEGWQKTKREEFAW